MGLFNRVMSKQDSDIEEFLNTIDEEPEESYEDADAFVKPMDLISEADATASIQEARAGNIVLLNIDDLSKRNAGKFAIGYRDTVAPHHPHHGPNVVSRYLVPQAT